MLPADFPIEDLEEVVGILKKADFLLPGSNPPEAGIYHPAVYFEGRDKGVRTIILPDRNVASRIAQLARGKKTLIDVQLQRCASLVAFAHLMDIDFEPGIAFHELAHRSGNAEAEEELGWFRAADNAPPQDMLNVALRRVDGVSRTYSPLPVQLQDMAHPLLRWNRNYITALKILELDSSTESQLDKVLRLLEWMDERLVLAGPAVMLACIYLGTCTPSRKNVFKDRNANDRQAAIAGVKNAAWDITHLSDFVAKVNQVANRSDQHYLFASFDNHLMLTTRLLLQIGKVGSNASVIASGLTRWWSPQDAERIALAIMEHLQRIGSDSHVPRSSDDPDYITNLIALGEQRLIESR